MDLSTLGFIGAAAVVGYVVGAFAMRNHNREKEHTTWRKLDRAEWDLHVMVDTARRIVRETSETKNGTSMRTLRILREALDEIGLGERYG